MRIANFLQLNDWGIKKFLAVVLAIQLAIWGLIGFEILFFELPILRQLVGFIYLTFIPGYLVLRVLKIHNLDSIESLLYAVGLSLASLMFIGFFMNTFYPLAGIQKPISLGSLILTLSAFILILCILCYKSNSSYEKTEIEISLSPAMLFLFLIPLLSVFGAYLVNYYDENKLLMFSIVLIALIPGLIAAKKIDEKLYPLAIFVTSLFLLLHRTLISEYIWGWDIQLEYYFSRLVITNGYWDSSLYGSINGMLAIVMLAPIYSLICNLSLIWVFKIIYQVLFSFLPLSMYYIFQKRMDKTYAFFACFFFVSVDFYSSTLPQLARQQIAEIFLVLLIALILSQNLNTTSKPVLAIVFGLSLIVSHYGTAYLFMFIAIAYLLLKTVLSNKKLQEIVILERKDDPLDTIFVFLYMTVILTWYWSIAGSKPFITFVNSTSIILTEFANPSRSDAFMFLVRKTVSPLHDVTKILYYLSQLFVAIGILGSIKSKRYDEFSLMSLIFFSLWVLSILTPYYGFDFTRIYHISLIVLSFYFSKGYLLIFEALRSVKIRIVSTSLKAILSTFLLVFLLFNSGWVYEIAEDNPTSIALSKVDYPKFNNQEVSAAKWLHSVKASTPIYADYYRWLLLIGFEGYPYDWLQHYNTQSSELYMFFGSFNIRNDLVLEAHEIGPRVSLKEYIEISELNVTESSKIYNSIGAAIYLR